MKHIAFILAVLFFGLVIAPCSDSHTCNESEFSSDHNHSEDEKDHCTPLCMCACCSVSYTIPILIDYPYIDHQKKQAYDWKYQNNYAFTISNSVWHPPSLS